MAGITPLVREAVLETVFDGDQRPFSMAIRDRFRWRSETAALQNVDAAG
jgi:hypothetical protein